MRILHCCLASFYVDNYSYQENILPKMHKQQGHEVAIIASTETYLDNNVLGYVAPKSYYTEENIPITRLSYVKYLPTFIAKKLRFYIGLTKAIEEFSPDIIFLHDCQFMSIREIATYAKKNPSVKIYVDGHADFINSAKSWISKNILHGIIYKYCAKKIEPYTKKYYGTLPIRVEFMNKMYGIPLNKIELLVMGVDDSSIDLSKRWEIRASIRDSIEVKDNQFLIITGGKIDKRKNIHLLMQAIKQINDSNLKLLIFGTPNAQMEKEFYDLLSNSKIKYIGWIPPEKVYDYYFAADLAVFPGTHSVLWEQAVGIGLPCIFKRWNGIQHVDLGGNCLFIDDINVEEIRNIILKVYQGKELYESMKRIARGKGINGFSYSEIARKAIEE